MKYKAKASVILHAVHDTSCGMGSRDSIYHARNQAAQLAVGCGMEWAVDDFKEVQGYWKKHYFHFDSEYCYALAIAVGNMSYIKAFEKATGRKPFFANNVTPVRWHGYTHMNGCRQRERLAIRSEVTVVLPDGPCYGEVTSINSERVVITVRGENRRILKLTHEKCAEMFPAPKRNATNPQEATDATN